MTIAYRQHPMGLFVGLMIMAMALVMTPGALAQAKSDDAQGFVRGLADDAFVVMRDDDLDAAARAQAFRHWLRSGFDLRFVSRFVMGRYWRRASAPERAEFALLFEDYLVALYGRRLKYDSPVDLRIAGQRADGKTGAVVHSRLAVAGGPAVALDWRLKQRKAGWRVVDIMIDGVSLAFAQRAEFASVIRANDGKVEGLLAMLRDKTADLAMNQNRVRPTAASSVVR